VSVLSGASDLERKGSHVETFFHFQRRNVFSKKTRRGNVCLKNVSPSKNVSTSRSLIGTVKPFSKMRRRGNVRKTLPALAPWKRFISVREKAYPWKRFETFPRRELRETFPRGGTRKRFHVAAIRDVETFSLCLDVETVFDGETFWRDAETWKRFWRFCPADPWKRFTKT